MMTWAFGIDIGYTNLRVAMVDSDGHVLGSTRCLTDVDGGASAVRCQVAEAVDRLRSSVGSRPIGAGVGIAGQVDIRSGIVRCGPNLFWNDEPLEAELSRDLGIRTVLRNDVVMATMGEWKHGAGRGFDDVCCMFVGTGIGGGAVSGGRLVNGSTGSACHFGHISVDPRGRRCTCGRRGCMEAIAGGRGIGERAREMVAADPAGGRRILALVEGEVSGITARTVAAAACAGDPMALEIRDDIAAALADGASDVVNSLNPSRFILGGPIVSGFPELFSMVRSSVLDKVIRSMLDGLEIVPSGLGDDAGVIGAAMIVLEDHQHLG